MAGRIQLSALVLWVSFALGGCHFFEESNNVDDALDNCPMNWGYPCPCDAINYGTKCGDNSVCLYHTDPTHGFCSPVCADVGSTRECVEDHMMTNEYGVKEIAAICASSEALSPNNQCMVICEYHGIEGQLNGQCPPGTRCDVYLGEGEAIKACLPIPGYPPSDLDIQRQQSCMGYCAKTEECSRVTNLNQDLTFEECKASCIHGNWHEDPCGSCLIGCHTAAGDSCTDYAACLMNCPCFD